jgi:hypothetical protein
MPAVPFAPGVPLTATVAAMLGAAPNSTRSGSAVRQRRSGLESWNIGGRRLKVDQKVCIFVSPTDRPQVASRLT